MDRTSSAAFPLSASSILFLAAAAAAVLEWIFLGGGQFGKYVETMAIARNLVSDGTFANPFGSLPTGPSAHLAPLYPLFIAAVIKVTGDNALFVLVMTSSWVLTFALHAALLPYLSTLLFETPVPGIYAAVLAIALPAFQIMPQWEALAAAVALMVFLLCSERLLCNHAWGIAKGLLAGALAGLLLLLNPMTLAVEAPWVAWQIWRGRRSPRFWASFAMAAVLACTPWTLRNYRQFGQFIFIRDNFGLEFYTSNNDAAQSSSAANAVNGCYERMQANHNLAEAKAVRELGETAYNRSRLKTGMVWVRHHPRRFLCLTAKRALEFWFPSLLDGPRHAYSVWLITVLSLAGAGLCLAKRAGTAVFPIAAQILYSLPYYVVQSSIRFRYPVLWASLLLAGFAIHALFSSRMPRQARFINES